MARKYRRDNKGRFAGGGGGATARGGRLKTASGNKRKTQTMQSSAAPKGTIGKPRGLKPGSIQARAAAAKPAAKKPMTKAEYEAAAVKAWGAAPKATGSKPKVSADQQLSRLAERSGNATRSRSGLTRAQAIQATELGKQTGRAVRVTQNPYGSFDVRVGAAKSTASAKPARAAAKPAATKGARLGGTRRTTRAAAIANTAANRTGQSKTLNRFNSRPERTRGAYVGGRYVDKAKLTGRQALDLGRSDDRAFARTVTKAARTRAAAPAKAQQKQTTAQRATRAATNQKRVTQTVLAKASRRPTSKQRRSIMTAESAKRFYATKAVDYLKVNVKKPGFRLPRGMR